VIRQSRILPKTTAALVGAMTVLLAVLVGCNSESSKNTSGAGKVVQITGSCFVKTWQTQLRMSKGESVRDLYLVGDTLHILTDQNFDHALRPSSGELEFFNQVAAPDIQIQGGPCLVPDGFIIARGSELYLFNREGRFQKSIDLGFTISNQPASVSGSNSSIIVGLDEMGGRVVEVDVTREINPVQWEIMTNGLVDGAAAVTAGGIFAGSEDGAVRGFTDDRSVTWPLLTGSAFKSGGEIVSSVRGDPPEVKAAEAHIYFTATDGVLYCVDCAMGKLKWRYFAGTPLETAPEVTMTTVYQYVPGKGLVALDRTHKLNLPDAEQVDEDPFHTPRWIARNGRRFVAEDAQYAYILSSSNSLLALDKVTGALAFESHRRDLRAVATNLKNSTIYASTRNGAVMAIQPVLEAGSFGEVVLAAPR
jgi:hypothetical protein